MKIFPILSGWVAAGVLGYLAEPVLRPRILAVADNAPPAATAAVDSAEAASAPLQATVTLKEALKFSDESAGLFLTVKAGCRVKLLRIEGANAIVRPGDTGYSIPFPLAKTDFAASFPEERPAPTSAPKPPPPPSGDSVEPVPMPKPPQPSTPAPVPKAVPPTAPQKTAPAPAPVPAAKPAPAPQPATPADIVKIMQESIRAGRIKEFGYEQVLDWKAAADETVGGVLFHTGTVSYNAETIFGVKTIQAKAMIKDGIVQRWIWPKSGVEIE
jgi:hypothetical protein